MATKNTPGPWVVLPTPFNEGFSVCAQPHPAMRGFTKIIAYVGDKGSEQEKVDASLIAAAPDLLSQHNSNIVDLEFLRRAIEENDPKAELLLRVDDILRRSREAIAKTEAA